MGYSGIPLKGSEGYLRKRRKDIFGRGSEIPRPCIRRPVVGSTHLTGSGSGLAGSTSIGLPLSIHLNYSVFDCQWLFDGIHKEEDPKSAIQ